MVMTSKKKALAPKTALAGGAAVVHPALAGDGDALETWEGEGGRAAPSPAHPSRQYRFVDPLARTVHYRRPRL
jgi:hypothetical protein